MFPEGVQPLLDVERAAGAQIALAGDKLTPLLPSPCVTDEVGLEKILTFLHDKLIYRRPQLDWTTTPSSIQRHDGIAPAVSIRTYISTTQIVPGLLIVSDKWIQNPICFPLGIGISVVSFDKFKRTRCFVFFSFGRSLRRMILDIWRMSKPILASDTPTTQSTDAFLNISSPYVFFSIRTLHLDNSKLCPNFSPIKIDTVIRLDIAPKRTDLSLEGVKGQSTSLNFGGVENEPGLDLTGRIMDRE
ncbi:hypothetical protein C8F04DRAFT_1310462 [Mycena alexandri]|uniref:Uncharacterized protein n=1 Tax=Mycena alexandri TaxID=1745969 RepID=A0AAD6WPW8_9AGAR|nr:hypothetical protein C8F04DRAFT_1310462 [Mycena alexandri]